MKRLLCLLLVLSLLLVGCGKKEAEVPTEPATEPTTEAAEAPTTEATEAPTEEETEPEAEPTEHPLPMVNPLTGEPLEDYYSGRPVAFTINNISAALPQYGLNELDWMFEVETEGGITRCVGMVADPSAVGTLGPIRSARTYFLNLSVSYNAPLFHCGASKFVKDSRWYAYDQSVDSWDHIDQMSGNSKYFYRDSRGGGYATEHTLFSNGERMANAMEELGLNPSGNEPVSYGYQFSQEVVLDGQPANTVSFKFNGGKRTTMEYDAESGMYLAHQYGSDWIDATTRENAQFRNVLIIAAEQTMRDGGKYIHSFYELSGSGDGWFAVDGQIIPIKWFHEGVDGPFRFTLSDGTTPITLGVGSTYCAILDIDCTVEAE